MVEKESLYEKSIIVSMNDAEISSEEKYIIGTSALATCIGVLLYSEDKKRAIVAHVAPDGLEITTKIAKLIIDNNLQDTIIKYKIIPGYYEEHYNTKERLEKSFKQFIPFTSDEIPNSAIIKNEKYTSNEFIFDALAGKFIVDKDFYDGYYKMMEQKRGK